ncbi:hypothetical protein DQ237_03745 [Blastococcus sp. TF02-8]|uniref:hypothetical protein n=1 Tax=Blastococcus sp. TF02-8 TaxID=2250574 RepID=UPI000DE8DDC0|nr:hypothetical protein [Blastococcus sp. TF02-8]RBY98017.1 hypothetical protein DQ237_03745 [Blastococcus sp. TF02-8]
MTAARRNWGYTVDPPDGGWIWIPRPDESVAVWAEQVCEDLYVEGAAAVELGEQLRSFATALLQRAPDLGALWIPDPVYGVLATLRSDRYKLTSTLEEIAEAERSRLEPGLAAPEVGLITLPAGPALRVRRVERQPGWLAGDLLVETVRHLVAPPGALDVDGDPTGIELLMSWTVLHEGDEFADMADQAAGLLQITGA